MLNSYEPIREALRRKEAQRDAFAPQKREILRALDLLQFRVVTEGDAAVDAAREFLASLAARVSEIPEEGAAASFGDGEGGSEFADSRESVCERALVLAFLCGYHRERRLAERSDPEITSFAISDSAYLGALLVLPHELAKAAVLRHAEAGRARRAIGAIRDAAATYDFRNGMLRRKFDAVKWRLVETEDLCFALGAGNGESEIYFPTQSVEETIASLKSFDERREEVIKNVRDVTRFSKMAINALHRDERSKHAELVDKAARIADRIFLAHVAETPGLRWNFSGGVEEWLEAKFFETFIDQASLPELAALPWQPTADEVVGALSDVTGEAGRWAVNTATKEAVIQALDFVRTVYAWMLETPLSGGSGKKKTAVLQNMAKLERVMSDFHIKGRVVSGADA